MAGDPILIGLPGATLLMVVEQGGRIQSFERSTQSKKLPVYNGAAAMTDGMVYHDFSATYNVEIITIRTSGALTGIALAAPGVALMLGNITTGNGVTAGGVYCDTTRLTHQGENLERFALTATQMPGLT